MIDLYQFMLFQNIILNDLKKLKKSEQYKLIQYLDVIKEALQTMESEQDKFNQCHCTWKEIEKMYKKEKIFYRPQIKIAHSILNQLENSEYDIRKIIINMEMQAGKSGTMSYLRRFFEFNGITTNPAIFLTGLSSKLWVEQTTNENNVSSDHVFHRNKIEEELEKIISMNKLNNCLIFIDEAHVATSNAKQKDKFQVIKEQFHKIGLDNDDFLIKNNIYLVYVSATPETLLFDLENSHYIKIDDDPDYGYVGDNDPDYGYVGDDDPDYGYVGVKFFKEHGLYRDATLPNALENWMEEIKFKYIVQKENYYHLIRLSTSKQNIKQEMSVIKKCIEKWNIDLPITELSSAKDANYSNTDFFKEKPTNPNGEIVIIKNMLRMSQQLYRPHIGGFYGYSRTKDTNTNSQGFVGRTCGYYDMGDLEERLRKGTIGPYTTYIQSIDEQLESNKKKGTDLDNFTSKNHKVKNKRVTHHNNSIAAGTANAYKPQTRETPFKENKFVHFDEMADVMYELSKKYTFNNLQKDKFKEKQRKILEARKNPDGTYQTGINKDGSDGTSRGLKHNEFTQRWRCNYTKGKLEFILIWNPKYSDKKRKIEETRYQDECDEIKDMTPEDIIKYGKVCSSSSKPLKRPWPWPS